MINRIRPNGTAVVRGLLTDVLVDDDAVAATAALERFVTRYLSPPGVLPTP